MPSSHRAALVDLFRYTRWADRRMLAALREAADSASGELVEARELLSHQLRAQEIWLERVTGTGDAPELWATDDFDTCRERLETCAERWIDLVQSADDLAAVDDRNSAGTAFSTPLRVIAHHVVNHATHHRAQIAQHLRAAGFEPPATDYIYYDRG